VTLAGFPAAPTIVNGLVAAGGDAGGSGLRHPATLSIYIKSIDLLRFIWHPAPVPDTRRTALANDPWGELTRDAFDERCRRTV
jgi:hypothetical protein